METKLLDLGYAIGKLRKYKDGSINLLIVTPGNYSVDYPPEPPQSIFIEDNQALKSLADAINYYFLG